jgi:PPOX class probable F420-dependent enzyme
VDGLPEWGAALLEEVEVAHLGLLDEDGEPRVQPVTFARLGATVVSAIDLKPKRAAVPARVRRLRHHPRAALTVDRYDPDWTRLAWVQLLGDVTVGPVHPAALEALQRRYPAYRAAAPPGPLLTLRPTRVLSWRAAP